MKYKNLLLLTTVALLVSGCGTKNHSSSNPSGSSSETSETSSSTTSSSSSSSGSSTSSSSGPTKVVVPAHTLSDTNPPIDIDSKGQKVSKDVWDSFRNGGQSKFIGNYNYTYTAYSGGVQTTEAFTKNGYFVRSSAGRLYYERKSGNTFYQYIDVSDGWRREETTLDLQDKYTYRINHEIYVHMFDYENYEYSEEEEMYNYRTTTFGASVKFQGGYLTFLHYSVGASIFQIKLSFETTIDIPKSYYYE